MTPRATRTRKARRTRGRCPLCHRGIVTGQLISLVGARTWLHTACLIRRMEEDQ